MINCRLFLLTALAVFSSPAMAFENDRNEDSWQNGPYVPRWQEGGPEGGPDRADPSPPDRPDPPDPPAPPDKPDKPDKPDSEHGEGGEGGEGGKGGSY